MPLSAADSDFGGVKYGAWSKSMSYAGGALWFVVEVEDPTHNYIVCPVTCEGWHVTPLWKTLAYDCSISLKGEAYVHHFLKQCVYQARIVSGH